MKIKQINSISNLGQFINFHWHYNLADFDRYNFFYGWNYSGKTTLSRLFRCLELKQLHPDYRSLEFSIELYDNKKITQKDIGKDFHIRVFNEDFIEENFEWNKEEAEIEPILILGKESKELEEELKNKEKEKFRLEEEKERKEKEKKGIENEIDKELTNNASNIRKFLNITNPKEFDNPRLKKIVEEIKNNFIEKIIDKNEENNLRITLSSQKLDKIIFPPINLILSTLINDVKTILEQKVTAQKIIEKLQHDHKLSEWVREGLELHKNETICQFCSNSLKKERIEELNQHFSEEFNTLMDKIEKIIARIDNHKNEVDRYALPDKARFFDNFKEDYENELKKFNNCKYTYIAKLDFLKGELLRKKENPFASITLRDSTDSEIEGTLHNFIEKIKTIIKRHNNQVDSLDKEKEDAKQKLLLHYAAEFLKELNYHEKTRKINDLEKEINDLEKKIRLLDNNINNIKKQIKESAIGADKINEYLNTFFGDDRLKITNTENGKYRLFRNDQIAKNLSTGEKNIISLVYFFAKLEESNFDFQNAIIFIDDPVSSLDSNHMHMVYGFISKKLINCGQLFITTHNFDFFNLLKDMYRFEMGNQRGKFYLIRKIQNKNREYYSIIENLPEILLKHKSEYKYLFSLLNEYNKSQEKNNYELLYILPNVLRRFLELYLCMRYPNDKKFKEKATLYFKNTDEKLKTSTLKICNEYSHEENPEHAIKFPDINELSLVIEFVIHTLEEKDKEHYEALVESLNA